MLLLLRKEYYFNISMQTGMDFWKSCCWFSTRLSYRHRRVQAEVTINVTQLIFHWTENTENYLYKQCYAHRILSRILFFIKFS